MKVADIPRCARPSPTAMPMPAVIHINAAVVNPETPCFERKIVPAPRKQLKREEGEHATSGSDEGERSDTRILARYLALQAD